MAPTDHEYLEQFMAQYRQQEVARLDTAKARLKTEIIPRLKQWGVSKVRAEYSGYGDSGCIERFRWSPSFPWLKWRWPGLAMDWCPLGWRARWVSRRRKSFHWTLKV